MKTYSKIYLSGNKVQIGVNQDGETFMRLSGKSVIDLVIGSDSAVRDLNIFLERYLKEMELPENGLLH